jgi:hypothetical protein
MVLWSDGLMVSMCIGFIYMHCLIILLSHYIVCPFILLTYYSINLLSHTYLHLPTHTYPQ